ncbi:NAD-dependent epimerase/dehydratase family protein [Terriglobus sp. 2YAB30_2]|uniref:NAD-dependent epimerase/dehydratase family protein n=2 Tax=unclassified Terriglobus TaxID=2628988 RepID=UPI003F9948BB
MDALNRSFVIFGGNGFIGTHTALTLLAADPRNTIYLVDIRPPRTEGYARPIVEALSSGRAVFVQHDVRQPMPTDLLPQAEIVFNFAAIHREPGHAAPEYFETNLLGAEHVCDWATRTSSRKIIFTSSISPYGPSESRKDERSIPTPESPYGSSKLAAEKIHLAWLAGDSARRLVIMRPGVVFGPGEGGNVTRLVRSLVKGYFVYMGNRDTIKAGGYVKELCQVMLFAMAYLQEHQQSFLLLNFSFGPTPKLQDFVRAIQKTVGLKRSPLSVPRSLLLGVSYPVSTLASAFGIKTPINPVRVRKLFRSTNVYPMRLEELGYRFRFTLEEAFEDWKKDLPEDFS